MLTVPKSLPWLYALLLLTSRSYILLAECSLSGQDGYARNDALGRFFDSIDKDGNGQIEAKEASQYIADNFEEGDAVGSSVKAAQQMSKSLDGGDSDATVSKAEVETHLRHLLKVRSWLGRLYNPIFGFPRRARPLNLVVQCQRKPKQAPDGLSVPLCPSSIFKVLCKFMCCNLIFSHLLSHSVQPMWLLSKFKMSSFWPVYFGPPKHSKLI